MQLREIMAKKAISKIGFGTAPLGNMYRNISEEEALATVASAWDNGIRLFDTAPLYGAGLAEIRLGKALATKNREDYLLISKVGRIILDELEDPLARDLGEKGGIFEFGRKNKIVYDYSEEATLKSIEDSLKRLNTDYLDYVMVHDPARDFYGDNWIAQYEIARTGAFRTLNRLRDEGVIKGWGLGVNEVVPVEVLLDLEEVQPDATVLAGRYSLLDHEKSLQRLMPNALKKHMDIVVGGPYSSGILAGGTTFEYQQASPEIIEKVNKMKAIAEKYDIPLKAAALQFSLAHPAVAAVIPGASKPERILEDQAALEVVIPSSFWKELREQKLIAPDAPTPK
ncbi:aldo/keto reductase [Enterococcus faecalis]|uniref:aldo/keto reductase n=1 Tax=Enterococcus faecalis TaxID=1351 RepID=UPI000DE8AD1D|nr:aldo/keto reductase [Enterococcus faecalis]EGO8529292.1 aldo/keto reductase [Enterococcus faecalis]EKZ0150149.1 aldo/keto reductase [Enterococcus faecalis]EME3240041.1 aldo/keto reductase [Enterococcus faecalis]NSN00580.1 aldo/keto reductase [Enterococcus faecalis]NSN40481.1 aldo/keto reductase [Enterococcus faecalis]